ncbi:MAG: hypothetical protein ACRYFS_03180 [Janthinobacterium lividum]
MSTQTIEERLTAVETELQQLKQARASDKPGNAVPWWEQIRGQFKDDPHYMEAMRMGREWRESEDPINEEVTQC